MKILLVLPLNFTTLFHKWHYIHAHFDRTGVEYPGSRIEETYTDQTIKIYEETLAK